MSKEAYQKSSARPSSGKQLLSYEKSDVEGECILLQIAPVQYVSWRYVLFVISNIFAFIPWLLIRWYPSMRRVFYFSYCSLAECTHFSIKNYDEQVDIVEREVKVFMTNEKHSKLYVCFTNRYMTYIIDDGVVRVSMYDYRERIGKIIRSVKPETGLN
jgi:hypothetical protein